MKLSFGARLRAQRERRQVSLHTISHDTKIKLSLLDALERDDVSSWPEGIFRRSWVRSYAQAIGLNPAEVLREFLVLYPEPVEPEAPPPTGMRRLVAALAGTRSVARTAAPPITGSTVAPVLEEAHDLASWSHEIEPHAPMPLVCPDPDLPAIASICTRVAQAREWREVAPLLREASIAFDAVGMILWIWEPRAAALRPAWAHGYPDEVVVNLPRVYRNADNAIASAFGTEETVIVHGDEGATGAVVTPMLTPAGCVGVLAIELRYGSDASEAICALAAIVSAQLAALFASTPLAEAASA